MERTAEDDADPAVLWTNGRDVLVDLGQGEEAEDEEGQVDYSWSALPLRLWVR